MDRTEGKGSLDSKQSSYHGDAEMPETSRDLMESLKPVTTHQRRGFFQAPPQASVWEPKCPAWQKIFGGEAL